ncbi:hypothetical protein AMTRI_Chr10g224760 [Amborella trichopoda]
MGSLSNKLPDELLEEILVNLSIPSILNFKRVSKSWFNLLSSPCFLHLHSLTYHSPTQPFILFHPFFDRRHRIFTVSLKHHERIIQLRELPHSSSFMPKMVKCSNGILCILTYGGTFYIVNPATGQSTHLPHIHGMPVMHFGFYFDPQNRKFKVIAVQIQRVISVHKVFDSTIRKWVEPIEARLSGLQELISIGRTCYIYNRFHTVDLIAFDMVKEELEIIPAPIQKEWNDLVAVLEWDGCISIAVVSHSLELRLWALRKEKTWEKVVDADLGELRLRRGGETGYPYPEVVVGNDILMAFGSQIISYGIESGRLNALSLSENELYLGDYISCKPTLLSWEYEEEEPSCPNAKRTRYLPSCLSENELYPGEGLHNF